MRTGLSIGVVLAAGAFAIFADHLDLALRTGVFVVAVLALTLRDRLAPGLLASNARRDRRALLIFAAFFALLLGTAYLAPLVT